MYYIDIWEAYHFLKQYEELCISYDFGINGCGCCDSPYLKVSDNLYINNLNWDDEKKEVIFNIDLKCDKRSKFYKKFEYILNDRWHDLSLDTLKQMVDYLEVKNNE